MDLPEFTHFKLPELMTEFELAQLHCLRSIAVSLESLVLMHGLSDKHIEPGTFGKFVDKVLAHSVRVPDKSIS